MSGVYCILESSQELVIPNRLVESLVITSLKFQEIALALAMAQSAILNRSNRLELARINQARAKAQYAPARVSINLDQSGGQ